MAKENWYQLLREGKIRVVGRREEQAPNHPRFDFIRDPNDTRFAEVIVEQTEKPLPSRRFPRLFRGRKRVLRAQALLPPHMQPRYGFGRNAEDTDCYGMAIAFNYPYHCPRISRDRDVVPQRFTRIAPEDAETGDLWELHHPYQKFLALYADGTVSYDTIDHCTVIATPDLVWTKNGSGLISGFNLSSRKRVFNLYDSIRRDRNIEPGYEHRYWRRRSR